MIVMVAGIASVVGIAGSSAMVVPGGTWREGGSGGAAPWWRGVATVIAPFAGADAGDWDGVVVVVIPGLDLGCAGPEIQFRNGIENFFGGRLLDRGPWAIRDLADRGHGFVGTSRDCWS